MLKDIGARFGLSQPRVSQVVSAAGMSRSVAGRKKGTHLLPAEERRKRNQEIVRLYTEGRLPAKEAAARFGLTEEGVLYILRVAGVRRRSRSWRAHWPWKDANERSKEITAAYVKEGLSILEIAARFGLSQECVYETLDGIGAITRSKDIVRDNHDIIRVYLEEGLTIAEIATRFGVKPSRVSYVLYRAHVRRGQPSAN
jgi:DNA-directed RNA polymerase specialized sigma subunit